jgi:crossover junction endodeoxyribonuclease RuvC
MRMIREIPKNLDATDGLAAAVCHHYQRDMPDTSAGYKSWKDFIAKNPKRIE